MNISRNSEGVVDTGGIQIKVPKTHSMLGFLGERLQNGMEFREDFWVYMDGKKLRHWTTHTNAGFRIWTPRLDDLEGLVDLYEKIQKRNAPLAKRHTEAVQAIGAGGKAHAKVDYSGYGGRTETGYRLYSVDKSPYNSGLAYSYSWEDNEKPKLANLRKGQELYEAETARHKASANEYKAKTALLEGVEKKLWASERPESLDVYTEIDVKGYRFLAVSRTTDYRRFWWELLSKEPMKKIELKRHSS